MIKMDVWTQSPAVLLLPLNVQKRGEIYTTFQIFMCRFLIIQVIVVFRGCFFWEGGLALKDNCKEVTQLSATGP